MSVCSGYWRLKVNRSIHDCDTGHAFPTSHWPFNIPCMSIDWTDSKKWQNGDKVAEMLTAITRIKGSPAEASAEAFPEILAVLKVQRLGIADVYEAVHKITRYNEATHEQFSQQIEVIRTLVKAAKEQDKIIRKLTKRIDSMEKKVAKKNPKTKAAAKSGWFG